MFSFVNDSNAKFLNPVNNFETIGLAYYLKYLMNIVSNFYINLTYISVDDSDFFRYILESISGIVTGSDSSSEKDCRVSLII